MIFDPDLLWQFALELINDENRDECRCRTAANRAYYAMFHVLRIKVQIKYKEIFDGSASDHSRLRRALREKRKGIYADALTELYELREIADYRLDIPVSCDEIEQKLFKYNKIYEMAKTL